MEDVSHPSVIQLERLAAKLPLPGDEGLETHVAGCEACGARMREVVAEREAFLVANPPRARAAAITGGRRPEKNDRRAWWFGLVGAAASIGIAVTVVMCTRGGTGEDDAPYVGVKGGVEPKVAVQPSGPVAIGGTVTVTLDPGGYTWAAIVSTSGGTVEVLDELPAVKAGDARSYVVDASRGDAPEELAVVYAARPMTTGEVAGALASARGDVWVKKISIPKQKPPTNPGSNVLPP